MLSEELQSKRKEWLNRIQTLSDSVWEGRAREQAIRDWLQGFCGETVDQDLEHLYATFLLQHFIYFGDTEVTALLYAMFRDHVLYPAVQQSLANNPFIDDAGIRKDITNTVESLRIVPVGNVSESGAMLSYRLRQIASLPTDSILSMTDLLLSVYKGAPIKQVILIDDFLGTGDQLCIKHSSHVAHLKSANISVQYIALVGMKSGIEKVRAGNLFDSVEAVVSLDESYSLTQTACMFLDELSQHAPLDSQECLKIVAHYGNKLLPNHPMGNVV